MAEVLENATVENFEATIRDDMHGKYLTFLLEGEDYGIEIHYVKEIINMQSITPIPEMPAYVKGIINLRGTIVPVLDVRLRFNFPERAYDERTCIIVVEIDDMNIGFIVDGVQEVMDIDDESIVEPPSSHAGYKNEYIKNIGNVGDKVILMMNICCMIDEEMSMGRIDFS